MGTDNRKIQIDTVVDASGARSGFDAVKDGARDMAQSVAKSGQQASKGVDTIGSGADASAKKIDQATKSIIGSIQRQTAVMEAGERGGSKYYEAIAAQRGVSTDTLKPYLAQLDAATAKQKAATGSLDSMGMSAKQFSANMRGVPAQFTDIFVSLQGGQKPLSVLFQQGGQLKDMFGGVGNAFKALGGYALTLINPVTVLGGSVAALSVAWYQGAKESEEFRKSLILTGNAANTSSGQLSDASVKIAAATGATVGAVAETMNEIAASGKISSEVMGKVGQAAIALSKAGGAAASETVKEFASLGDEPVKAIIKLNDKYHFLTASVYEQIKALQDQGRESDAAKLAQSAYADTIESRIPSLKDNLGVLEKAWAGVWGTAKGAWDAMVGAGREKSLDEQLRQAIAGREGEYDYSAKANITTPGQQVKINALSNEIEARDNALLIKSESDRVQKEAIAADQSLSTLKKSLLTKEELIKQSNLKIAKDTAAINLAHSRNGEGVAYSDKQIADLQKAAADKITGPAKSTAPVTKSQLGFDLDKIKRESEELTNVYANSEKIMQSMHAAGLVEDRDYYESKAAFIRLNSEAKEQELQKEIARMGKESLTGKDKIDNAKKIFDAEAKLTKIRADATTAQVVNATQAEAANRKIAQSYEDANSSAKSYLETVARQNQRAIAGVGMGAEYRTEQAAQNQIEDKFSSRKTTLDDDLRRKQITKDQYGVYLEIATDAYEKELAMHSDTRDKIIAKQGDWANGMTEALANYATTAKNVAQQTSDLFTNAFKSMEDAFVSFVKTGKLDFKSLAESMIADLARMQFKAAAAPITAGLGDWVKGLFNSSASSDVIPMQPWGGYHSGGIAGSEPTFMRNLSASVFSSAPRFHTGGLAGDEIPAVLKKGEGVFTAGQMKALGGGGVVVNVIESPGSEKAGTTQSRQGSGGESIVDVFVEQVKGAIAKDIGSGGMVAGAMESQYGLNRAAGAWR